MLLRFINTLWKRCSRLKLERYFRYKKYNEETLDSTRSKPLSSMKITSYPPLSGTTIVDGDEVEIIVCIDLSPWELEALGNDEIQVALWHDNFGVHDWTEQVMLPVDASEVDVFSISPHPCLYYKTSLKTLPTWDPLSFTFNYIFPKSAKKWLNMEFQTSDAKVLFRRPREIDSALDAWRDETDIHTYIARTLEPESLEPISLGRRTTDGVGSSADPKTWVYNFDIPAAPRRGRGSSDNGPGVIEATLGIPIRDSIVSYFAIIKHGGAWVQPNHSRRGRYDGFQPPREAILVAFLTVRGEVVVFMPMSTADNTVYLKGDNAGRIVGVGRNDTERVKEGKVVVVLAGNVEEAVDEAVYWVKRIGKEKDRGGITEQLVDFGIQEIKEQADDSWSDALKYCTWNSLGRELTDSRVINAVNELYDSGIKVETVIIDDNWQSLDGNGRDSFGHRWNDFEADKRTFPNGLRGLVSDIKKSNPGVKHVAVWHGILGYWNGVSPEGWISRAYRLRNVGNGSIYVVDIQDVGRFYDDFYRFLSNSGVTAVKADTQCLLDERLPSADRGELFPAYLTAWRNAASKYFGERAISCMSMVPQILYTNHLYPELPKLTLRNSDDYFPHTPSSHPWHVFANAHNAVLTSRLNVTADWDMFQTKHDWAGYHAAARCLSGGPVYITDEVGKHDMEIIKKITAKGKNGELVVLRPSPGKSMDYFTGFSEGRPLKIVSEAGTKDYKIQIIGTFDLDGGREATNIVAVKDVVGFQTDEAEYAVYSHYSKCAKLVGVKSYIKTTQRGGWDTMSLSPIVPIKTNRGEVRVAVFGLLDQISGAAAIKDVRISGNGSTVKIGVQLKALGILGIFASYSDQRGYGRFRQVSIGGVDIPERFISVGRSGESYGKIRVDLETAWEYLRLDNRWDLDLQVHLAT